MKETEFLAFPDDFVFGTATSAYQIEGSPRAEGKGESVWDRFAATAGAIDDLGDPRVANDGTVACDHYRLWEADFDLMAALGLKAYRFSISWPRVMPEGSGRVNAPGLAFYDRLVDGMLERGIEPYATLFHWDLPQALQAEGGWANRGTIDAYLAYAEVVAGCLGDRVKNWMTHNEPWVYSFCGHLFGAHAPGLRDLPTALAVAHNLLLSHGRAVPLIRAKCPGAKVGIVQNLEHVESATGREEDLAAARRHDGAFNRWFLDPLFGRGYPADMMEWYGKAAPRVEAGDFEAMAAPMDFLGVNYYTRRVMAAAPRGEAGREVLAARQVSWPFVEKAYFEEWEIAPEGLYRVLSRVNRDYRPEAIFVTESGTPLPDQVSAPGEVHDPERISYIARHLAAAKQALDDGAPMKGYFLWSFMDNFEWGFGYTKRFGMIYVDYPTQKRIVKDSGKWYSTAAKAKGFPLVDSIGSFAPEGGAHEPRPRGQDGA